jgi:hypothetical protein
MPVKVQLSSQNPWPGLRAFTEKDRDFFFGREREIAELLELVQQTQAVVLYGQSGLGKTSLVQAGLFPELKGLDFLAFRVRFDHSEDAAPLAEQIKSALTAELDRAGIQGPRPAPEETLWAYFHRRDLDLWGAGNRLLKPLIVVDQFEEIFTLGQRTERAVARVAQFAADLESMLEHRAPQAVRERLDKNPDEALHYDFRRQTGRFVISLREDFLGYLDSWCRRIPSLLSVASRFRLLAMTGTQALEVVKRGGRDLVDDAVARDIVEFVSDARHRVAPALLSVVLEELNHRRLQRGQTRITAEFLSGERGKIIQDFYERSFEGIDPRVRIWVEDRLLTGGGHRQPAALEDALTQGIPESECDLLVDRRVLHRAEREGVVWLELTHDLLSEPASRSRAEREQRQQAEEVVRQKEQFKRELQRSRRVAGVFAALLVVAVAACLLVIRYNGMAKQSERRAAESQLAAVADAEAANNLNFSIVSNSWVPVATVEETIQNVEGAQRRPAANSTDLATRARILARAADALYEGGHFEEGLNVSSRALSVLSGLGTPGSADVQAKIARGETLYELGRGSLELNKLVDAERDFTQALELASSLPDWNAREDTSRIFVLSHIGLGGMDSSPCTQFEGVKHLEMALAQAQYRAGRASGDADHADRDEAKFLEIRALLDLGSSQWDPAKAQQQYSAAETILQGAEKQDPGNPRWRALSAALANDQADVAFMQNRFDQALSKLGEASGDYQELIDRDPLNWEWKLALASSRHLLGQAYLNLKEWDLAEGLLNESKDSATALLNDSKQTEWASANSLRAHDLESIGTIPVLRALESHFSAESVAGLEASFQPLSQAASILGAMQTSQPQDLRCSAELAEVANFRGMIQDVQAILSGDDKQKQERLRKEALASFSQGLNMMPAIEQPMPRFLKDKGEIYSDLADLQDDMKLQAASVANSNNSIAAYREVVRIAPTAKNYGTLSGEMKSLGDYYEEKKVYAQALSQYEQALSTLDMAIAAANAEPASRGGLQYSGSKATLYGKLAGIKLTRGDVHGALEEIGRELDTVWQALPTDYTSQDYLGELESCKSQLNTIEAGLRNSDSEPPYRGLTAEQKKALLTQAEGLLPRTDPLTLLKISGGVWPIPPLFPGAWRTLSASEYGPDGILHELSATRKDVIPEHVLGIRGVNLDFYGDSHLYEVAADGLHGTLFYLWRGKVWVQLKGSQDAIQQMNKKAPPRLDTVARAAAYLRFYLATVQNANLGPTLCRQSASTFDSASETAPPLAGLYSLLDQEVDVPWFESATQQQRTEIVPKIAPLQVEESPDHEWQARGTVECGGNLFDVTFRLTRSGILDASQANKIDEQLPAKVQFFSTDGIRTQGTMEDLYLDALKRNPDDKTALSGLVDFYAANKQNDKEEHLLLDVMKRSPNKQTALDRLIDLYDETKQPEKEERLLLDALKQNPDSNVALDRLVEFYHDAGQQDKEEALLLGVLKQEPENEGALGDLMQMYSRSGQYGKEEALLLDELKRNPANERALRSLPGVYYAAKDWKDAVQAEGNWIDYMRGLKADARHIQEDLNNDLIGAYASLAWFQIFARDFSGALTSTDTGLKVNPADLRLAAEHAEALLFLNRTQEADAIFLGNRGKEDGWERWEVIVLDDFDVLEKAGLTNPELARLRPLLSAKPAPTAPAPKSSPQNSRPN